MLSSYAAFLNPYSFGSIKTVKNRLCLAPITNCQSNEDGTLGDDELAWLERNAKSNFGVIFTCASYVTASGKSWNCQLGIHHDDMLPGLEKLANRLKQYNCLKLVQIFHGGVRAPSRLTGLQPISASAFELPIPNFERPREMTHQEIQEMVEAFANAAYRAYQAGFDGIELHGANGYLITQFISQATNLRKDEYGGSLENRARFIREIMQACRARVPSTFLLGARISPENMGLQTGLDLDESLQIATWLKQEGADFIDLSLANLLAPSLKYPKNPQSVISFFRNLLGENYPIFAAGGVRTAEDANNALNLGATFVSIASMAIGNVEWPKRAMEDNFHYIPLPYTVDHLKKIGISDHFIAYILSLGRGIAVTN